MSVRGLGIHLNFSVPPPPPPYHDDGDKVTTRDAHCGHHNEHLKKMHWGQQLNTGFMDLKNIYIFDVPHT